MNSLLFRHPSLVVGAAILAVITLIAFLGPALLDRDPGLIAGPPFVWPGQDANLPFGTDIMGRDIASGLIAGARSALLVGLFAGLMATAAGSLVGLVSGYFGGWIDSLLTRTTEVFQVMPNLLLAIFLVAVLGTQDWVIILAISLGSWPSIARLVRAETLRVRSSVFVSAAIAMDLGHPRIVLRHILPNVVSPALAMLSVIAGHAILTESTLAFLGLGNPDAITWGGMIGDAREALASGWYMIIFSGGAITVTVVAFSLFGSGLNDLLDPRD